jgi:beta-lactamase regulating signal transducer with metallopeptidase domain
MLLTVFENAFLLRSIGWAIANSFWQAGLLWLIYRLVVASERNVASLVKYHLGISLLLSSFTWFIVTAVENYRLLSNADPLLEIHLAKAWMPGLASFNQSLPYLSIAYLLLLGLYSGRFFTHLFRNCSLQRTRLSKAPIDIRLFSEKTALLLGIKRKIQVWVSDLVDVPSVTGFIKPVILLPAAIINHLSIQQTEAIILHELAHVKRNDYLINLVQSVIELVLYFNPFVSLLVRRSGWSGSIVVTTG